MTRVEKEEMKGLWSPQGKLWYWERGRASPRWGICKMASGLAYQIGSYFGASLCSVDMDGDGSTDLVLIGAPHYYEQTRGGQVSVCPMPGGVSGQESCLVVCGCGWRAAQIGSDVALLCRGAGGSVRPLSTGSRAILGAALERL